MAIDPAEFYELVNRQGILCVGICVESFFNRIDSDPFIALDWRAQLKRLTLGAPMVVVSGRDIPRIQEVWGRLNNGPARSGEIA